MVKKQDEHLAERWIDHPLALVAFKHILLDSTVQYGVPSSSFAGINSSVFCYYLGVGRSLYLDKPPDFIRRLAVCLSTPLTARSTIGAP